MIWDFALPEDPRVIPMILARRGEAWQTKNICLLSNHLCVPPHKSHAFMNVCKESRTYIIDHLKSGFDVVRTDFIPYDPRLGVSEDFMDPIFFVNPAQKVPCTLDSPDIRKEQPVYWDPKKDIVFLDETVEWAETLKMLLGSDMLWTDHQTAFHLHGIERLVMKNTVFWKWIQSAPHRCLFEGMKTVYVIRDYDVRYQSMRPGVGDMGSFRRAHEHGLMALARQKSFQVKIVDSMKAVLNDVAGS